MAHPFKVGDVIQDCSNNDTFLIEGIIQGTPHSLPHFVVQDIRTHERYDVYHSWEYMTSDFKKVEAEKEDEPAWAKRWAELKK